MLEIKDFTCINDQVFLFCYELQDALYSSAVIFENKCTSEQFTDFFPEINETLEWINSNITDIKSQTGKNLPDNADLKIFKNCTVLSFSFRFNKDNILSAYVAYGDEEGIYLISDIRNRKVFSVEMNLQAN